MTMKNPDYAEVFATRVKQRIKELGLSVKKTEELAGLKPGRISDLVSSKSRKTSVSSTDVPAIASALQCSVAYLFGIDDNPSGGALPMASAGVIERGTIREKAPPSDPVMILPDPRFPPECQTLMLMGDNHGDAFSVPRGFYVLTVPSEPLTSGIYVVRTDHPGGVETSLREAVYAENGMRLIDETGKPRPFDAIIGRIVKVARLTP